MSFVLSHSMKVQWMSWTLLQRGDWAQMLRPVLPGHHLRAVWSSHVSWAAIVTGDCWFIDNSFIQGLLIHSQFNFRDPLKINTSSRWTLEVTCCAISDVSDWSLGFRLNCTAAWHRTAVWLLLLYGVLTVAWLWILQGQRAGINDFALIGLVSCVLSLFISSMTCFLYKSISPQWQLKWGGRCGSCSLSWEHELEFLGARRRGDDEFPDIGMFLEPWCGYGMWCPEVCPMTTKHILESSGSKLFCQSWSSVYCLKRVGLKDWCHGNPDSEHGDCIHPRLRGACQWVPGDLVGVLATWVGSDAAWQLSETEWMNETYSKCIILLSCLKHCIIILLGCLTLLRRRKMLILLSGTPGGGSSSSSVFARVTAPKSKVTLLA